MKLLSRLGISPHKLMMPQKKSFREFCELIGPDSAAMRYMREYEREHPEIAKTYYDMRFETLSQGQ